jgi:PEP-CTERM motif
VTAVPEPASWAMMIGGFGLIGAAARRRSRPAVSFA